MVCILIEKMNLKIYKILIILAKDDIGHLLETSCEYFWPQ